MLVCKYCATIPNLHFETDSFSRGNEKEYSVCTHDYVDDCQQHGPLYNMTANSV